MLKQLQYSVQQMLVRIVGNGQLPSRQLVHLPFHQHWRHPLRVGLVHC